MKAQENAIAIDCEENQRQDLTETVNQVTQMPHVPMGFKVDASGTYKFDGD